MDNLARKLTSHNKKHIDKSITSLNLIKTSSNFKEITIKSIHNNIDTHVASEMVKEDIKGLNQLIEKDIQEKIIAKRFS
jgi:hypothetical protein